MDTNECVDVVAVNNLPSPVVSLEAWAKRRADFNRFVNEQLKRGIDYGVIPGVDKPTLLKPGAEKIMQLYGCAVELEVTRRDLDTATGHLSMEFTAKAISLANGTLVGMGVGSCSTYESKYRYRYETWKDKRNAPAAGEGWEQKTGKWGAYWARRTENRDLADQWNTVLKMGKKRAMVDLALTISGASERFTQDIEDVVDAEPDATPEAKPEPERAPRVNFAWSDAPHGDSTVGEAWLLKAAQATSLTTDQVRGYVGDLHKYGSGEAAKSALMAAIEQAQAEPRG